jgi:hypothetical protein
VPDNAAPWREYEARVFNFLVENAGQLGISSVILFENQLMDGAVELEDGTRVAFEIKFRMNWLKACQAEWQFRTFLRRTQAPARPVESGVVFFDKFSGDWNRALKGRPIRNGWIRWYDGHCDVEGLRLDLLHLHNGALQGFPAVAA